MFQHQNVWLPDGERHLVDWMTTAGEIVDGKGTYQIRKLRKALSYCTQFRTAVDIGAHCGLWTMQLAKRFVSVHAYEPVEAHRECLMANLAAPPCKLSVYHFALGDRIGGIKIRTDPTSSGDSWVDGEGDIPLDRLDRECLKDVDFIKADCEGYELFALRGGEETIKRCKPVVIVEQKPGRAQKFGLPEKGAVDYLAGLGYRLEVEMSGDFIMTCA